MNQQECLESFKQMLGAAMMLGIELSIRSYRGLLPDEENHEIRDGIEMLHRSTSAFLAMSCLEGVSAEQVVPLYEEIQQLSRK